MIEWKKNPLRRLIDKNEYEELATSKYWPIRISGENKHHTAELDGKLKAFSIEKLLFGVEHQIIFMTPTGGYCGSDWHSEDIRKIPSWILNERLLKRVEEFRRLMDDAIKTGRIKTFGLNENCSELKPGEFLEWYREMGYPLRSGLIPALGTTKSMPLLKRLRTDFLYQTIKGENPIPSEHCEETNKLRDPTKNKLKMAYLHETYVSKVAEKLKNNKDLNSDDFWKDPELRALFRDSGLPKEKWPKEETVKEKWVPEARKLAKVPGKKRSKKE